MVRFFQKLKLDKDRPSIFACIKSIDTQENNQDGGLTYDQFIEAVMQYFGDRYSEDGVRHIFSLFDEDGDGVITKDAFKKIAAECNIAVDFREVEDYFTKASSDERVISFADFALFMKRDLNQAKNNR